MKGKRAGLYVKPLQGKILWIYPVCLCIRTDHLLGGKSAEGSVENAVVLEETAMIAWHTLKLNPTVEFQKELADKHYFRKHGANAYYGQK